MYSSPNPEDAPLLQFHPTKNKLVSNDASIEIGLFQKVKVQITVTDAGENAAQRSKLVLKLIEPHLEGMVAKDSKVKVEKSNRTNKKQKTRK